MSGVLQSGNTQNRIFLAIVFGFVLGVALHSFFYFPLFFILGALGVGLTTILTLFIFLKENKNGVFFKHTLLFFIFVTTFSVGLLRYDLSGSPSSLLFENMVGQEFGGEVIVIEEPDTRQKTTLLTVEFKDSAQTKLLLIANRYPRYSYGDVLMVEGILEKPKPFETEQGKVFDYPAYLAKDDILYMMFYPELTLVSYEEGNVVKKYLLDLKSLFIGRAGVYIPEPEISLLGGLLVGAKHGLNDEWQAILRNAGIIHIVVLSGYNITIVAEAIMRLFGFLTLRYRVMFGVVAIALFAVMTGGSATVVRASLMALLVLLARATGRTYAITRALLIAGALMVFQNPKILVFDPSFQLSFLATLGLVYLSPLIEKYFHLLPTKLQIRELVVSTISTQIFVTPLLLYMMGVFSIVSLPVNLLILPLIPFTMLAGFITGLISLIAPILSFPFAYATYLLLHYIFVTAHFFGTLSFATVSIPHFNGLMLVVSYTAIVFLVVFAWYRLSKKQISKST